MLTTIVQLPEEEYWNVAKHFQYVWDDTLLCFVSAFMHETIPIVFRDEEGWMNVIHHGGIGVLATFGSNLHALREYLETFDGLKPSEEFKLYSCHSATLPKAALKEEGIILPLPTYFPLGNACDEESHSLVMREVCMQSDIIDMSEFMAKITGLSFEMAYQSVCSAFGGASPFDPTARWCLDDDTSLLYSADEIGFLQNVFPEERGLF